VVTVCLLPGLAAAVAVVMAAPPAASQDPRAQEARKACAAGDVDRGIKLLADLISENGDPNALYNQGRCYQQNGRHEQAISRFREYLRTAKDIPSDEARTVEGYIKELEAELEAKARREIASPAATTPPPTTMTTMTTPTSVPVAPSADVTSSDGRSLRIASIALGVLSVAALGTGIYAAMRVDAINERIAAKEPPISAEDYQAWSREGERAEVLQWVGYGVSAGALAGAITCYLLSTSAERARPVAAVTPRLGPFLSPTSAGAVVRLGF
jgi:tetratricopeptide (TPR) repeat protein